MGKIVLIFLTVLISLGAGENTTDKALQKECLHCHTEQQIPSGIIYRRYLLKYSSKTLIREKIFAYLKVPSPKTSIMPAPFFNKFLIKEVSKLDDETLHRMIDSYIKHFDIDQKIYIVPEETI
ncbi:hypothetical protein YH65_06300 [Sulfurovum lithotrophicum]|uniref:Cytochrome c domain-containing protein n=1 Tax=Sulfurovum lithotrophicum TaxID=206403 RepID=A0A7U4RQS6_9BACT|nr:hypothetical protein [Sulfurovum lithotrophicum]AKF25046.1 hypothetical protein YH65_06300 [Sulfurovum lithotrophicum]